MRTVHDEGGEIGKAREAAGAGKQPQDDAAAKKKKKKEKRILPPMTIPRMPPTARQSNGHSSTSCTVSDKMAIIVIIVVSQPRFSSQEGHEEACGLYICGCMKGLLAIVAEYHRRTCGSVLKGSRASREVSVPDCPPNRDKCVLSMMLADTDTCLSAPISPQDEQKMEMLLECIQPCLHSEDWQALLACLWTECT